MTKHDAIDGAAAAAKIMRCLPLEEQEQLFATIRKHAPKVAATIECKMSELHRLAQGYIRPKALPKSKLLPCLPASTETAEPLVIQKIIEYLPETTPQALEGGQVSLAAIKAGELKSAQRHVLKRLEELYPEESAVQERSPLKPRRA